MAGGPLVHALTFPDATSVPDTPASGETVLYVEGGILKVKDDAGVVVPLRVTLYFQDTPPADPGGPALWVKSDDGALFTWHDAESVWFELGSGASQAEGGTTYTAGDGLALTGSAFSVNVDDSTIEINADALRVKAAGITSSHVDSSVATSAGVTSALSTNSTGDRNRANHTGTQTASTISDFAAAVAAATTTVPANRQTGNYTLVIGDAGGVVEMNVASANELTVPPNSSVAFPVDTVIEVVQWGAGLTSIVAGSGVTIRSLDGVLDLAGQYASVTLRYIGSDEWHLAGALAAA